MSSAAENSTSDLSGFALLPLPKSVVAGEGTLSLRGGVAVACSGHGEPRLAAAIERFQRRLARYEIESGSAAAPAPLELVVGAAVDPSEPLETDESCVLAVTQAGARLEAATVAGALHGIQTFLQLIETTADGPVVPAVQIQDAPRFPWRGLMIDACRHWIPKEVVLRNLDAMEAAKLNVLHLHLSEDQAFRIESLRHPKLHEVCSGGEYFSQDDIREIIASAHERGIRVVPEFDLPGHSLVWLEAYPELAIDEGPWKRSEIYGIHPVGLDPTREEVHAFFASFFEEMAELFPDPWVHIGGDEAATERWDASERVQAWRSEQGLADSKAIQAHFTRRLHKTLAALGKHVIGWEEMRDAALGDGALIQAWLSPGAKLAAEGHATLHSHAWYLDWKRSASFYYAIDPFPSGEEAEEDSVKEKVYGGEAPMWSELVDARTIDSRIWPAAAVVAERLWSPRDVANDEADLYRRLDRFSQALEALGLRHESYREELLMDLAGGEVPAALRILVGALEEAKDYDRHFHYGLGQLSVTTPLDRVADAAAPESREARAFATDVEALLAGDRSRQDSVAERLDGYARQQEELRDLFAASARVQAVEDHSRTLAEAAQIARGMLAGQSESAGFDDALLERLEARVDGTILAVGPALVKLVAGLKA